MREVAVDRFIRATPPEIERALSPADVVAYEGSFDVLDIDDREGQTIVTVGARGIGAELQFEPRESGLRYEQVGDAGPFEEMWTEFGWEPENEGTRVSARSGVSLALPIRRLSDRIAGWKRRGELKRALRNLAADLE